jgi:hypothetical protein
MFLKKYCTKYFKCSLSREAGMNKYKDVEDYFSAPPTYNEKVAGIIVDLEHRILTLAEEAGIEDAVRKRLQEREIEIEDLITELLRWPE